MKERPIIFSTPMVKAILEGRKIQTRRIINPQPEFTLESGFKWKGYLYGSNSDFEGTCRNFSKHACKFGKPGDRLWVRETFQIFENAIAYVASPDTYAPYSSDDIRWKPSIFMPRKLSRITLEITNIRVERLQDISDEDAIAEGIVSIAKANSGKKIDQSYLYSFDDQSDISKWSKSQVLAYKQLWEQINGKGSWDLNPWVWVIQFRRVM